MERGSARLSSVKGQERAIVNQINIGTVSKPMLGETSEKDRVEHIWAFLSAYLPSWTELNSGRKPNLFERLWVRVPAEAAGEFSSPVSAVCTDSYFSVIPHVWPQIKWHCKLVHSFMVYIEHWHSSSFRWHQPCNNQTVLYPLQWTFKMHSATTLVTQSHMTKAHWVFLTAENSTTLRSN